MDGHVQFQGLEANISILRTTIATFRVEGRLISYEERDLRQYFKIKQPTVAIQIQRAK